MKKSFCIVIVISLAFLFPASIKTQWHTNGFLNFPGMVAFETEKFTNGLQSYEANLQTREYVTIDLASLTRAAGNNFTFETRFFLDDAEPPATLLTLVNGATGHLALQIRKERAQTLVAELSAGNGAFVKLSAHKTFASSEWLALAVVYETTASDLRFARLYLNGNLLAETTMTANWLWPDSAMLYLGGMPRGKTFSGKLDEVRISKIARYRDASYALTQTLTADPHTLGLWNFEPSTSFATWREHERTHTHGAGLSAFSVGQQQHAVSLEWHTDFEQNLTGFVIERRASTEESKFVRCGYMPAFGTTQQPQAYHFVDMTAGHEVYYYRLRAIDENGDSGYSHEIASALEVP